MARMELFCTLITSNIVFSSYNPYDATVEKANGTAKVLCKNTTGLKSLNYTVTFSPGSSGNQIARLVKNGVNSVSYNLYKEAAFTNIYGNGSGGTVIISKNLTLATNGSNTDTYTIYGRIPVQPLSKPMTYIDTITATLWYIY